MKSRQLLINVLLLAVTAGVGLLLCEFGSRLILNPGDYLSVEMAQDDVLGAVLPASSANRFDKWGFRNREVPESSDIVAIGDSHTFGNTAKMDEAWPKVLEHLTGRGVYNMGMGGYGPNQYYYLLKTRALGLKPRMIICGLYIGDDFENSFSITYGLDHWAYLRQLPAQKVDSNIWDVPSAPGIGKSLRVWLSRHSVIYQLIFHGSFLGRLQGEVQVRNAPRFDMAVTSLVVPEKNILEAFRPASMLSRLDQGSPRIREGMRITFELLKEMNEISHRKSIRFIVVIIPTKEMVFSKYLDHNSQLPLGDVLNKLIVNERVALARTSQFLNESGISFIDTLPALTRDAENQLYARTAADMHPNKNGYRVIAETVFESLRSSAGRK